MRNTLTIFLAASLILISNTPASAAKPGKTQPSTNSSSQQGFSYTIGAVPAFVDPIKNTFSQNGARKDQGDVIIELNNRQISLLDAEPQEYVHLASRPLSPTALQEVSQVYIDFNPEYQKLVLHRIQIWRDGKATDLTHRIKLDLLRRETNLDKLLYEGNVTAVGVLPDTHVNDVIDIEYTVTGANPIFGKYYSGVYYVSQPFPVNQYNLSVLTQERRPLKILPPQGLRVKEQGNNGHLRYIVEANAIPPVRMEDKIPEWYQPFQLVQISEYQNWGEVRNWANQLFRADDGFSPEIEQQLQAWKKSGLPKDRLAVEVLRWVQGNIRYFGIELGVNSHKPSSPNVTVERKYGDCKDKSLLLSTLLKTLGIDAEPTLVSTSFRRSVENMLPSPTIFNHVIVRITLDGKNYWVDPTLPPQFGTLEKLGWTDWGSGLVMGKSDNVLQATTRPDSYENVLTKTDHFTLAAYGSPVQLTSQTRFNHNLAEFFREGHARMPREEFNKIFQETILRLYPKATPLGDVDFTDNQSENEVTVTSRFAIDELMRYEPGRYTGVFFATELLGWATFPEKSQRSSPYALPRHSRATETVMLEFPMSSEIKPNKSSASRPGDFWTMSISSDLQPSKMSQSWSLKANRESVPSQKIAEYSAETRNIREQMGFSFRLPIGQLSEGDKQKINKAVIRLERTYGKTSSTRVKSEIMNAINMVLTTNDIASGKLNGKALAEAYKIRSQTYDHQGDVLHSLEDIRAARNLDPENIELVISEADTLLGDAKFSEALMLYEQAIQSGKSKDTDVSASYKGYGQCLYYLGQNKKAQETLDVAMRSDGNGPHTLYAGLWRFIAAGGSAESAGELQSALNSQQEHAWPYEIGAMLLGKITPEQLIVAAQSPDKGVQEDQLSESYFYIGKKYLMDGNTEKAKANFQKSLDQGVTPFIENNFALHELGKKKQPKPNGFWQLFD